MSCPSGKINIYIIFIIINRIKNPTENNKRTLAIEQKEIKCTIERRYEQEFIIYHIFICVYDITYR